MPITSAWAAARSRNGTFLSSRFWHLARTKGHSVAAVAVAHSILVAAWHILHDNVDYNDLGNDWHSRKNDDRTQRKLVERLEKLTGKTVTIS